MKGKKLTTALVIVYVLLLVVCSASWIWQLSFTDIISGITKTVAFEDGVFKRNISELTVVLHEGETEKLDDFSNLKSADFQGSDCTEEIFNWAAEHPGVSVRYDVPLPNGLRPGNNAESVDFTGIDNSSAEEYAALLKYFPQLSSVEMGCERDLETPLTGEDIAALREGFPELEFSYSFTVMDRDLNLKDEAADLSFISSGEFERALPYLACMKNLKSIELGDEGSTELSWDEIGSLEKACPGAEIGYKFTLYDKSFSLNDELLDLSGTAVTDHGEALLQVLPYLSHCKTLDMDSGPILDPGMKLSDDEMENIREKFPEIDVIWRIWFGTLYSVRTDTERILASKPTVGGTVNNIEAAKLGYCRKLKYLDLGHNEAITDISFVSSMPELEVFIISMNPVADLSPLADCPKLEYFECSSTYVNDVSPLKDAKALRHLNISCTAVEDISPLYGLSELERFWIGSLTPVPPEQVAEMQEAAPNCKISTASDDPHGDYWRYTRYDDNICKYYWIPRYEVLREQLGYNYQEYSFYWLDKKCGIPAPPEYEGIYYGRPEGE
ncbi:MAG: leucine-rich repeat domain-containing protein [Candidatus Limivicinus sp.]|jgi:hypothetical protein